MKKIIRPLVAVRTEPSSLAARPRATPTTAAIAPVPGLLQAHDVENDRQFSMNLARGLQVLRVFTPADSMLGNRDISDRTGLPKATVSRLTYTLMLLGYLSRIERFQKYRLGPGVLSLGYPLLASLQVRQAARPFMEAIARDTGCNVNLGMRDRLGVVYLDTCRVDAGNIYQPDIGSTRPLLSTAIGRALILASDKIERTAILARLRLDDADRFRVEKPMLDAEERHFRDTGFTFSRGDWRQEVHAIAVPIRMPDRHETVAMNCTMSTYRLGRNDLERKVAPRLMEAALRIQQSTGLI